MVLAVKSQHTEAALDPLVPLLGVQSFVLSMQNGLNPHAAAERVDRERTLAAFVNSMGTDYQEPGRIMYGGPGTMRAGELGGRITPRLNALVAVMRDCFVPNTEATDNVWGYLWGKKGFGAMLFAGAVMDQTIADMLAEPTNRNLLADIVGEVVRVADAERVRYEPFDGYDPSAMRFARPRNWPAVKASLAGLERRYRVSLKANSGIWRDLAVRRRPTEVGAQLGELAECARPHGISVPLIDQIIAMIHEIERGPRRMDAAGMEVLRTLDRAAYPNGELPA